jgi:ANTAR domain-containing protein
VGTPVEPGLRAPAQLHDDGLRASPGTPAVLVVRGGRGWRVLRAESDALRVCAPGAVEAGAEALSLVEAMSLADLVAAELGLAAEPDRQTRRAARSSSEGDDGAGRPDLEAPDPRDEEIAGLRRTVRQLEHALAARVSIERAIGVLAERHDTTPREAFEELRRRARSLGRPAQELAAEVLDGLLADAVPARRGLSTQRPRPAGAGPLGRRGPRDARGASTADTFPEARS